MSDLEKAMILIGNELDMIYATKKDQDLAIDVIELLIK